MKPKWSFFTKRTLSNLFLVCAGVLLYLALANINDVSTAVGNFVGIFMPFILGIGIAYLLNIPVSFFERRVFKKLHRRRSLSILVVYLIALLFIVLLIGLIMPQLIDSIVSLFSNIPTYIENLNGAVAWVTERFSLEPDSLDFILVSTKDIVNNLVTTVRGALPDLFNWTVRFGSGIVSMLTAIIASIYFLASKEKLLLQCKKVIYALFPKRFSSGILRVSTLSNRVFSGFIGGKIIDSAIIGAICYVFMLIMDNFVIPMPLGLLISVIVGVTNVIPFFGPFIGAIPSVLILLLINPWSAVWFTGFIIVLQQFDGNILGPKILGDSTGLPALWVLVAIIIGGGLFGFSGMILGVPTVAVLYTLASDFIARRLQKKGMDAGSPPLAQGPEAPDTEPAEEAAAEPPPREL